MRHILLTAAFILGSSLAYAQTHDVLLLPSSEVPLQGTCSKHGLAPDIRGNSASIATLSCAGTASAMMNLDFADGSFDRCVYIDNADPKNEALFVPVRTAAEWVAFKTSTQPGGKLYNEIHITYGCEATNITDVCDRLQALPRGRGGSDFNVTSQGTKAIRYTCAATNACGVWTMVSSSGSCAVDGMCGAAAGVATTAAPSADLCSVGTPNEVKQGTSTWQWQCSGVMGGANTQCTAPLTRDGVCGSANGNSFSTTPRNGLCDVGVNNTVEDTVDGYYWACRGENGGEAVRCSAGRTIGSMCGPADGGSFSSPPTTDLCKPGFSHNAVDTNGQVYHWLCYQGAVIADDKRTDQCTAKSTAVTKPQADSHWHVGNTYCSTADSPPIMAQSCPGAEGDVCAPIGSSCTATLVIDGECNGTPSIVQMRCY